MTYAGRLDPMASGLLLILTGEECKKKEKYLALGKEYEFEILFGFATDTYDILGKIQPKQHPYKLEFVRVSELEQKIRKNLKFFTGKFVQKYPMFSSKTVAGKPLFAYAREGVDLPAQAGAPERVVNVKNLKFLKIRKISNKKLLENIERRVAKVRGDFRQKEILKIWQKNLKNKKEFFYIAKFKIKCSGGTYVRSIANFLGEKISIPALAFSIKRTKVGKLRKIR